MYDTLLLPRSIHKINGLILQIYKDREHSASYYTGILKKLQEIIYFDCADIMFYRAKNRRYELEAVFPMGWEKQMEALYRNIFFNVDDGLPIFCTKSFVSMISADIFGTQRSGSEFYANFLKPAGFEWSMECNIVLTDEEDLYGICTLARKEVMSDFTEEEKKVMELIQPHLSNAVQEAMKAKKTASANLNMGSSYSCRAIFDASGHLLCGNEELSEFLLTYRCKNELAAILNKIMKVCKEIPEDKTVICKIEGLPLLAELKKAIFREYGMPVVDCKLYDVRQISSEFVMQSIKQYGLTTREEEILKLKLRGKDREYIAKELFVSVPTIKKHLTSIYTKLGVENQNQLLYKIGFIDKTE